MGKWLNEFLAESKERGTDKADTLATVSGMSVPNSENPPGNQADSGKTATPSDPVCTPGCLIAWQRADLTVAQAKVDFLHTDAEGTKWAFVTLPEGGWAAVNLKYARRTDDALI